jgi:hypothetical protein
MRKEDSYPFDGGNQPLQLRRGSDKEARRSLIEKYQGDLNKSGGDDEMMYNPGGKKPTGQVSNDSFNDLANELKQKKRRNLIIALAIGAAAILIITLILVLTLKKKDKPVDPVDPPKPEDESYFAVNPYLIRDTTPTKPDGSYLTYSSRQYRLIRDQSIPQANFSNSFKHYAMNTTHNQFIENVTLKTSVFGGSSFNTVRLTFTDESHPDSQYQVSEDFLSATYAQ